MGLRFRKSVGRRSSRVTFGKSGASFSTGAGPFRVSRSTSGASRATVSARGTGLSYSVGRGRSGGGGGLIVAVLTVALILLVSSCIHSPKQTTVVDVSPLPSPVPTVTQLEKSAAGVKALPDAEPTPAPETSPEPVVRAFVLNTSSHKYHAPGCSSVANIKPENRQDFTGTVEELEAMGYEPCGRCGG